MWRFLGFSKLITFVENLRDFKIPESEVVKSPIIAVCGDELGRTMISYYYGQVGERFYEYGSKNPKKVKFTMISLLITGRLKDAWG